MIKAIVFDFFGVLVIRGTWSFRRTYYPDDQEKLNQTKKLQDELGLGLIDYTVFISGLAKIAGVDTQTVLRYTEDFQPNTDLLEYIRRHLKPNFKLGIISNAGADWVSELLSKSSQELFDSVILSYKVGIIKPTAGIYEMSAENLEVDVDECLFVDDIITFCQGAEKAGMKSIWYQDFEQMKKELEALLAVSDN